MGQTRDPAAERFLMVRWRSVEQANDARNELSPFLVAARARVDWTSQMLPEWSVIEIPVGTVFEASALLELDPAIDRIEREPIVRPCNTTPNDDYWPSQQPSLDIMHTRCAWDKITSSSVLVAVLDDGVNYDHPDLYPNIWKNTAEINGSAGKDDDGDGIIDDFYGASFLPHTDFQWVADGDPRGNMALGAAGHGTTMASIMGAVGNNWSPTNPSYIAGTFWSGKMIPVQVYSFQAVTGFAAYKGMEYAYYRGARIMNCSFEMFSGNTPGWMYQFMQVTPDVLYVSAAGNRGEDLDAPGATLGYPQCFDIEHMIVLGNSGLDDHIYYQGPQNGTNWGKVTVDVFATGETWVLHRDPLEDPVGNEGGSSNSAAYTSGLAALVWTLHPSWTPLQVKQHIMNTADPIPALSGFCVTGARVNAAAAVGQVCP